eukprot:1161333-Pelagomonas_calceolata.AAC.5
MDQVRAKTYLGAQIWCRCGSEHAFWHPLYRRWIDLAYNSSKYATTLCTPSGQERLSFWHSMAGLTINHREARRT